MKEQSIVMRPIRKDLLHAKIADAIIKYIEENQLQDGDKLPPEREMAAHFNTSRNSVREALRVLEGGGLVEIRQGSGSFVKTGPNQNSFYVKTWGMNYTELLEVKDILEIALVKGLCGKLNAEEQGKLEEKLLILEKNAQEGIYSPEIDGMFHKTLWSFSGNKTLVQLIRKIFEELRGYWRTLDGEETMWLSTVPYHRHLYEAVREGRTEDAEAALRRISEIDRDITVWMQKASKPFKA